MSNNGLDVVLGHTQGKKSPAYSMGSIVRNNANAWQVATLLAFLFPLSQRKERYSTPWSSFCRHHWRVVSQLPFPCCDTKSGATWYSSGPFFYVKPALYYACNQHCTMPCTPNSNSNRLLPRLPLCNRQESQRPGSAYLAREIVGREESCDVLGHCSGTSSARWQRRRSRPHCLTCQKRISTLFF